MTREEILSMAREAGFVFYDMHDTDGQDLGETVEADDWAALERFVEVVLQRERTARQASQLRIEELQALLVRADAERCAAVLAAEKRWRKVVMAAVELACNPHFDPATSEQDDALERALIEAGMIRKDEQ
jgi:hypothetical protein